MSIPTPWSMARWSRHVPGRITRAGCGSLFASCRRRPRSRVKRLRASAKASAIPVYIESSRTRTFACAYDWPGWCRSGKDEASALAALAAYAPRYAAVAKQARVPFNASAAGAFRVVERLAGSAGTEFGVARAVAQKDTTPPPAAPGERPAALAPAARVVYNVGFAGTPPQLPQRPRAA